MLTVGGNDFHGVKANTQNEADIVSRKIGMRHRRTEFSGLQPLQPRVPT